jgi:hypothetical protein
MRYRLLALAALFALIVGGAALGRAKSSGISGLVVAAPTCPLERVSPAPGCAPRPLIATVRVWPSGERARAESVRSSSYGHFSIGLSPGEYTVEGAPQAASPLPRPPRPLQVQVRRARFTTITLTYDTGIR